MQFERKNVPPNFIMALIKKKRNYEAKLKKWLDNPVDTERTNAFEDHDLVI